VTSEALAAGSVSVHCMLEKCFFSLDLNVTIELLSVTVLGREFQVAGAEQRKARLANAVLAKDSDNRVVMAERSVRTLSRSLM